MQAMEQAVMHVVGHVAKYNEVSYRATGNTLYAAGTFLLHAGIVFVPLMPISGLAWVSVVREEDFHSDCWYICRKCTSSLSRFYIKEHRHQLQVPCRVERGLQDDQDNAIFFDI